MYICIYVYMYICIYVYMYILGGGLLFARCRERSKTRLQQRFRECTPRERNEACVPSAGRENARKHVRRDTNSDEMRCRLPGRPQIESKSLQNRLQAPWERPWARLVIPGSLLRGFRDAPGGCRGHPGRTWDAPGPPRAPPAETRPRAPSES